jgi:hypothetical protein
MLDSIDTIIAFVTIMLVVSMLITVAVQMVSALFNLRGQNLAKGLLHTMNVIVPGFQDQAQKLVDQILSGPLLSDSSVRETTGRCASAARPDEIFDAIHRIATGRVPLSELRDDAWRVLKGLGLTDADLRHATDQVVAATGVQQVTTTVQQLTESAKAAIQALPADQQATIQAAVTAISNRLNADSSRLSAYETAAVQQLQQDAAAVAQAVEAAYKKFKYWFEVGQERAQQWFTAHTRWWTIGFAVVFAFWFQLDTVEIYKLVSTNRAVRDALVAQSVNVTKQAEKILGDSSTVLQKAFTTWKNELTDDQAKTAVGTITVPATDTRESFRQTIKGALEKAGIANAEKLLTDLDKTIDKTVQDSLENSAKQFSEVKLDLDHTGFALFPLNGKGRWGDSWCDGFWKHLWGMIFSAALLSLGAPFWFNVLKSLSSLRSKVAENISTEQEGEKAPPGSTAPPAPAAKVAVTSETPKVAPATVLPST